MIEVNDMRVDESTRNQWNQYLNSYFVWAETWERNLLQNRQIVEAWQAEHDTPYPVYRLTYAIAPAEWSPTWKAERATIWSLNPTPNEEGYWTVIERGRAIRRRYQLWISVDAGIVVRPGEEKFGYTLYLSSAQLNVSLHPTCICTSSELEIQLGLTPLPPEPEQPRRIYEQLYPESAHDMFYASPHDLARREYNQRREAQGLEPFDPEDYETESWEGMEEEEEE
jgi:hypothetical protein